MLPQNVAMLSKDLNSGIEQMKKRDNDLNLKFIPEIPREFCFAYERFSSSSFCVDEFVLQNSRKVQSLEILREQLTSYLKLLKQSMVELIHEDYTEFINLSANLISFEKSIANLLTPLSDFQDETDLVQRQISERIQTILHKRSRLAAVRKAKIQINLIQEIVRHFDRIKVNVEILEDKLQIMSKFQNNFQPFSSEIRFYLCETEVLVKKFSISFATLSSDQIKTQPKCYFNDCKAQFEDLSKRFFNIIDEFLRVLIRKDNFYDSIPLTECIIRILLMHKRKDVLNKQILDIVRDNLDNVISESFITKNGCEKMLDNVILNIENDCEVIIKAITRFDPETRFDIVVESIWNEFVNRCSVRTLSLFSLAKAEEFYSNYKSTCKFCTKFLQVFMLESCRKEFEKLPAYGQLMSKFNLNVYFHMQLQQLVPRIETNLLQNEFQLQTSSNNNTDRLKLYTTQLFCDNIVNIWNDQETSSDLFPYLWKITIKIISRFKSWIVRSVSVERIIDSCKDLERKEIVERIATILSDTQTFVGWFQQFCDIKIVPLWNEYFQQNYSNKVNLNVDSMKHFITETVQDFHSITSNCLLQLIRTEILSSAQINLALVNDIPRLFRRTNKDKPKRASPYVESFFTSLGHIFTLMGGDVNSDNIWQKTWFINILSEVFVVYKSLAMELLTSVQKTEDSLKKLKKANVKPQLPTNNAMSDDDKIRLQIYLDVQQMVLEVKKYIGIELMASVQPYAELAQTVSSLKNLQ